MTWTKLRKSHLITGPCTPDRHMGFGFRGAIYRQSPKQAQRGNHKGDPGPASEHLSL